MGFISSELVLISLPSIYMHTQTLQSVDGYTEILSVRRKYLRLPIVMGSSTISWGVNCFKGNVVPPVVVGSIRIVDARNACTDALVEASSSSRVIFNTCRTRLNIETTGHRFLNSGRACLVTMEQR